MQSHKNTPKKANANHHRKYKPRRQPHKAPATFNPPAANVQAEEWGSSANPWPETVGELFVGGFLPVDVALTYSR